MADPEEEFQQSFAAVQEAKNDFPEDEQYLIESWAQKLLDLNESEDEKANRMEYMRVLVKQVVEDKRLQPPFTSEPPAGYLTSLQEPAKTKKLSFQMYKQPCSKPKPKQSTGATPKPKKKEKSPPIFEDFSYNEFEDPEEMARVIARSKGQSFAEFVVSIARHTADYGQELRAAMNSETTSFRDYVDNVLSQRIKDLTEVLDQEQNRELMRIKTDVERWQMELAHVKRRIKDMIPGFDIDLYRKDKNYLKKIFTIDSPHEMPRDDSFQRIKEENCHRLKWISEMTCKMTRCNEQLSQEITKMKAETAEMEALEAIKHQNHLKCLNCEVNDYQKLKAERDRLYMENAELMTQLKQFED